MKRFKKIMMCAAMTLAFAFCFSSALTVEAKEAAYQPGQVYVNPAINSKKVYYSNLKTRMETYSEQTVEVVYPKGATLSVKSNKKALQASIVGQTYEDVTESYAKVYVQAAPAAETVITSYYYLDREGEKLLLTPENGRFYRLFDYVKVYLTPNCTEKVSYDYPITMANGTTSYRTIYDDGDGKGYYYKNSKGTYYDTNMKENTVDGQPDYAYSKATIQLSATKAGTYKVNISANGQTKTLKVNVTTYGGGFKSATLDKKTLTKRTRSASDKKITTSYTADYKVSSTAKSGKFKVSADKGVKITGLVVASVNKDGKAVYKKVKNGKKISLSQAYAVDRKNTSGYYNRSTRKDTYVFVSYKDTYLGTSVTYSVTSKHGYKQIKQVYKKADGKKYVSYLDYGSSSGDYNIWAY